MKYRDQLFRMHSDNRRSLQWQTTIPSSIEMFVDSKPLLEVSEGENLRYISRLNRTKVYGKYTSVGKSANRYIANEDMAIRNFIKGLLTTPPLYNLPANAFWRLRDVIAFVREYNPTIKYCENTLSNYKRMRVKLLPVQKSEA